MQQSQLTEYTSDIIPVVDLGALRDNTNPLAVARTIHNACRDVGFLYVNNHGIEQTLIEQTYQAGLAFFRQPFEKKNQLAVNHSHRGFLSVGGAKMYDTAKPDLKESFVWGYPASTQQITAQPDNRFLGSNQWPASISQMPSSCMDYFDQVHGLAHQLLRAFALGMGVSEQTFLQGREQPISRGSYVYYPSQPLGMGEDQFGVGPHTDFGVLTLLRQDNIGGLQVQGLNGQWVDAPPIPDTLIINVGDLLERWTNHYYRSTPHRVINRSGQERLSLVIAYDPAFETLIDAHPLLKENDSLKELPIRCGDYLTWRFNKAFGHRKAEA